MITCTNCTSNHAALLFYCPNCGKAIVSLGADGDVLVFRSTGGWKMSCLVSFNGKIQDRIAGFALSPQGLAITNGDGRQKTIPLLDLLNRLKQGLELLEL